jgi:hypothetical protein
MLVVYVDSGPPLLDTVSDEAAQLPAAQLIETWMVASGAEQEFADQFVHTVR